MKLNKQSFILLVSMALLLSACSAKAPETTIAPTEKATPVQVELVKTGSVNSEAGFTAKLAPSQEVQISPKINGKITTLPVTLGQYVQKGTVLFQIDVQDLVNSVKQAEASYKVAQANLRQSGNSSAQGLEQSKNSLKQAEQALKDAQVNQQRMQQLFNEGGISAQQLEQANSALTNAQTAYANAKQALQTAQQMTGIQVSEASVNQAAVSLQNARTQLANAVVTAPISGYVSNVTGAVGQFASPQSPVLTIVNTKPLLVKMNVSEQDITQTKVGHAVKVEIPATRKEIDAKVTAVSPVMNQQLKAYPIEITIPNPSDELKADMVVNVTFNGNSNANANKLVIPRKAIFDREGKQFVYVLKGDIAKQVEVTTGIGSSDQIEIISGLTVNEKVVVKGQTLLKEGAKVEIQKTN